MHSNVESCPVLCQADIRDKLEDNILDPEKLQRFAIAGMEAHFDEALAGGKMPKTGIVSVKSSGVKKPDGKDKSKGGKAGKEKRKKGGDFKRQGGKKPRQQT